LNGRADAGLDLESSFTGDWHQRLKCRTLGVKATFVNFSRRMGLSSAQATLDRPFRIPIVHVLPIRCAQDLCHRFASRRPLSRLAAKRGGQCVVPYVACHIFSNKSRNRSHFR
jgi:hypothetical protein